MFTLSREAFRPRPTLPRPTFPLCFSSRDSLFAIRYSLSSPFSHSYPLFCTGQNRNPFYSNYFRTLCANHPGGGYTLQPRISFRNLITRHSPPVTILFVINTYKTDTKQTTLSFFRINTCAKTRGRAHPSSQRFRSSSFHFRISLFPCLSPLLTTHGKRVSYSRSRGTPRHQGAAAKFAR